MMHCHSKLKALLSMRLPCLHESRSIQNLRSELLLISTETEREKAKKKSKTENKSVSSMIMENNGFITDNGNGLITNLPLGKRVIEKIKNIVRNEMDNIRGQEIEMPALSDIKLWKTSGRDELMGSELFRLTDRNNKKMCLNPTHEEIVTNLVSKLSKSISSSCLGKEKSLRLYQITRKYRDESRPKHSLLRSREFLMKDMYSFHLSEKCAMSTYEDVCKSYEKIFNRLDVPYIKAFASVGSMGGQKSHEYLIESNIGEDKIYECNTCHKAISNDLVQNENNKQIIRQKEICNRICNDKTLFQSEKPIRYKKCIEVGHTFMLGDRYTKSFPIKIKNMPSENFNSIFMGCYGIGVSRIMQACIEARHLNGTYPDWPLEIAPFKIGIIPAKERSKFEKKSERMVPYLYEMLDGRFPNEIIVDDRTNMTIGRRVLDAKMIGVPILIVLGKCIEDEQVEILINSPTMQNHLEKTELYCHSRETGHVIKQLINDLAYKMKTRRLFKHS